MEKAQEKKYPRNTIEFEVSGNWAMFADPVTRVGGEKFSYHIPTYEAIKGVIHSIYYKPTIIWYVDEIRIMNPIATETKGVRTFKYSDSGTDLSYYTYLRNVRYQVRAHFEFNPNRPELKNDWNENKHHNIAKRMIERGGRRDVFLGTRECQAEVSPVKFGSGESYYDNLESEIAYGFAYHGITYPDEAILPEDKLKITTRFWHPVMQPGGYVKYPSPEEVKIKRVVRTVKDFKHFENNRNISITPQEG